MNTETLILMMANGRMGEVPYLLLIYFILKLLLQHNADIKRFFKKFLLKKSNDYIDIYKFTNRNSAKHDGDFVEISDNIMALSYYIQTNIKDIKTLQLISLEGHYVTLYFPTNGTKIKLTDTINLVCDYISTENDKKDTSVETITIELSSSKSRIDINDFMKKTIKNWKDNKSCIDNDDIIQISSDLHGIQEVLIPFRTDKSFNNLFFKQKDDLLKRIDSFQNSDIYSKLGIQRSLGLLFSGEPGTGKTSSIKAISKYLGYHIIPIQINKFMSKKRLLRIFQLLNMGICKNDIPFNKRLYLFEEIDCSEWADIVKARKSNQSLPDSGSDGLCSVNTKDIQPVVDNVSDDSEDSDAMFDRRMKRRIEESQNDKVTLSTLLELMDGLVEFPGRLIIITTNHPEVLDPALLRPGRIDMHIHFGKLRSIDIAKIYKLWAGYEISEEDINRIPNEHYTQAEISQLIFKYEFDPRQFLEHMYSITFKKED